MASVIVIVIMAVGYAIDLVPDSVQEVYESFRIGSQFSGVGDSIKNTVTKSSLIQGYIATLT